MSTRTERMKALRFAEFGPPSVLRIEDVAVPEPGEGEALVHVRAAAINPSDIADVAGRFGKTTLPRTPGRDFAGVVVKGKQHESDEVWGSAPNLGIFRDGSHAEYVVVPAQTLSLRPSGFHSSRPGHVS
jgi:NADPH:quinone reductase-like Zn-dependent oxidoreductase